MKKLACVVMGVTLLFGTVACSKGDHSEKKASAVKNNIATPMLKELKVYASADQNAKVIKTIPTNQTIHSGFAKKHWLRITIDKAGNIGWVRISDLQKAHVPIIYQQSFTHSGKHGQSSYQVVSYSNDGVQPTSLSKKQLKKLRERQHKWQKHFNQAWQSQMKSMDKMNQLMNEQFNSMLTLSK